MKNLFRAKKNYLFALGWLGILWVLLSAVSYYFLVVPRQHCFDFYPRWEGVRAVLARENPYHIEVSWHIQEEMFGRRQESHEIVQHFVYLPTITWLLLPFWILPYKLAVSLWCGLQLLFLLLCPLLTIYLLKWKLQPISFLTLLMFSILVFRYPINAYLLGQFIPFVLVNLIFAWWGIANKNSLVTIFGLVGMLVRPEVVIVPIGVLLIHNWMEARRNVVVGWGIITIFLWLLTQIWIGPWIVDFLNGVSDYVGYSFISWLPQFVDNFYLGVSLILLIIGWGGWMWFSLRPLPSYERLPWEISVGIVVALLVFPQPNNYTLILALIPIWVALWASKRKLKDWLISLMVLSSPWGFYAFQEYLPFAIERVLIPLITGMLLTVQWHRRQSLLKIRTSNTIQFQERAEGI